MMASPMHGSRIAYAAEMGAPSAEAAEHATHGGTISTPMPHLDASEHRHGGHCGIEWMAARPTPSTVLLLDIAAPVTVLDLPQIAPSPRDAHATGPPLHGDLQARLQVFRL